MIRTPMKSEDASIDNQNLTLPAPASAFADWLAACRRGSADDLCRLIESSRAYLLAVAECELGSTLRPKAGASDLVQDSLLEAHQGFDGFRGATRDEFLAWAAAILRRNLIDLTRRYRTGAGRAVGREARPAEFGGLADGAAGPPDLAARVEEWDRLEVALDRLPADARAVIRWRHEDRLGWDEIGRRVGKSAEAARKVWFRAVESLRGELGGTDDDRG
jgi:RNA polymerase sigma-70 factor (ECF subfamily)